MAPPPRAATPAGNRERPRVVLTFLAPAERCNQRCPACILDRAGEPVSERILGPVDYGRLVEELLEDGVPIRGVGFQGYEVTLPRSWPYVEAAFEVARGHRIRRSFITNGMLIDLHRAAIDRLDPHRISVSLDGADAETNDRLRGLPGAFLATTKNLSRFLRELPRMRKRVGLVSVLYDEENFRSLLAMPSLLGQLGVRRWAVSVELEFSTGRGRPRHATETLARWISELRRSAEQAEIEFHFNDEFGLFRQDGAKARPELRGETLFDPDWILRVEPTGHIRVGHELLMTWDADRARLWRPSKNRAIQVIGYPSNAETR